MSKEQFQPISNTRSETPLGYLKFYGRMVLDLQNLTIYRDLRKELPRFIGKVLDIGCGQSPYKFLLRPDTKYLGIDIVDAKKFDYDNKGIIPFDGQNIPFEDESMDHFICTEVLEHVENYQILIDELRN